MVERAGRRMLASSCCAGGVGGAARRDAQAPGRCGSRSSWSARGFLTAGLGLPRRMRHFPRSCKGACAPRHTRSTSSTPGCPATPLGRPRPARLVDPDGTEAVIVELGANDALARRSIRAHARRARQNCDAPARQRHVAVMLCRHVCAAQSRARITSRSSIRSIRISRRNMACCCIRSSWTALSADQTEPGGRHASDRRRRRHHRARGSCRGRGTARPKCSAQRNGDPTRGRLRIARCPFCVTSDAANSVIDCACIGSGDAASVYRAGDSAGDR